MGKALGAVLLIGGLLAVGFGLVVMNSVQYQAQSAFNDLTGYGRKDPAPVVAMVGGGIAAFIGLVLLISSGSGSKPRNAGAPDPETHVLCPDCRELVRNEARVCKHCGCKLVPQT